MDTLSYSSLVEQLRATKKEALEAEIKSIETTNPLVKELYAKAAVTHQTDAESLQAKIDALDNKSKSNSE